MNKRLEIVSTMIYLLASVIIIASCTEPTSDNDEVYSEESTEKVAEEREDLNEEAVDPQAHLKEIDYNIFTRTISPL